MGYTPAIRKPWNQFTLDGNLKSNYEDTSFKFKEASICLLIIIFIYIDPAYSAMLHISEGTCRKKIRHYRVTKLLLPGAYSQ